MTDVTLQNYNPPTLPQLPGGDPIFWRNELGKISKSINLLVTQENTVTDEVNTLDTEVSALHHYTAVGDTNYNILATDRFIDGSTAFTATRTWTLPAVSSVLPGQVIDISAFTNAQSLILAASGADKIFNEVSLVTNTSFTFAGALSLKIIATAVPRAGQAYWFITLEGSAQAARGPQGLNTESLTDIGDTNYNILATDRIVNNGTALTAPRTWTLPAVSSLNLGQTIRLFMGATATNTITVVPSGADQFYNTYDNHITTSFLAEGTRMVDFTAHISGYWVLNDITPGGWTDWIPNPGWAGGTPTATITTTLARYKQRGTVVTWTIIFTIGATGTTGAYILFTAPTPAPPRYSAGGGGRSSTAGKGLGVQMGSGAGGCVVNPADVSSFPNSDTVCASGTYEIE